MNPRTWIFVRLKFECETIGKSDRKEEKQNESSRCKMNAAPEFFFFFFESMCEPGAIPRLLLLLPGNPPHWQSLFFASSMLTNYSHLLTARANKHFRGLVSHSPFPFVSIRFVCFYFSVLQFESVNRNVYMQIDLMNGMVHVKRLTFDRIPKWFIHILRQWPLAFRYDGKKRTSEDGLRTSECYIELSGVFGLDWSSCKQWRKY